MLDELFKIVKQFGTDSVVNNPAIPNEQNQEVMADATKTIASGFQNIVAGGGLENILDLFKGGGSGGGNAAGLLKNPIVTMMVGYFISKLVSKYKMSPAAASQVANNLIPNSVSDLIRQTNDPGNEKATLDNLIGSLTGGTAGQENNGSPLQDLLDQFTGGNTGVGTGGGFDLQGIINGLTQKARNNFQNQQEGGGGLMDLIRGFM